MPGKKRPRRGSLAYWPKKRAKRIYPQLSVYPEADKAKVLAFAAYKVGMGHAIVIDTKKTSMTSGQEIVLPITVLDCPPLKVLGLRVYQKTAKGLESLNEAWAKDLPKDLARKLTAKPSKEEKLAEIEKNLEKISKIRAILSTQPRLSGIGKKKPEVFESDIGGKDIKEKFDFVKQMLGKDVAAKDVLKEGELVDAIAVTKGKGFQGPVKRFGIRIQSIHAKKKRRHIGSLGQERPGKVRTTLALAGQLGFQTRTELNKRLLRIGEDGKEVNPKSGFKNYGIIKSNYILLQGSVPGSKKRLILLRSAIRPSKLKLFVPEIKEVISG
jgi:large subunit ribosomal protein L3